MGDFYDDFLLLFVEENTSSISIVNDSCTLAQQGTPCLLVLASADDFLPDISVLFLESHTTDMGDFYGGLSLFFAENSSPVLVHSLHDQSYHIGVIVDPYVQPLQAISLIFEKTVGVLTHASEIPVIIEIHSPSRDRFSPVPLQLFLPKGRNIF